MKKIFITIISVLAYAMTLTSCSEASEKGIAAAVQLSSAWGDAQAIQKVAAAYVASRDSLTMGASSMDDAFIEACSNNDSIVAVAMAIAKTPEEMGKHYGKEIVDGLANSTMEPEKANTLLGMIGTAYALLGRPDDVALCFKAIDGIAQQLPENEQLIVYAHSCTPDVLGKALKEEHDKGNALDADRQAQIIETILTGQDLETFKQHYNGK